MKHRASVPQQLGHLADPRFFDEISKGFGYIQQSADNMDRAARDLFGRGHVQGSEVLRLLAEEEAGKALILLDAVRCPRQCKAGLDRTLNNFRNHIAKRIYAKAVCWRAADFAQIHKYVNNELASLHLDGPNDVDWILPNEIVSNRENALYVDYVREFSQESAPFWVTPQNGGVGSCPYATPWAITLIRVMVGIGIATSDGLARVADVWRGFEMKRTTTRWEIEITNTETLNALIVSGLCQDYEQRRLRLFVENWTAPMWSLEMKLKVADLTALRRYRREVLETRRKEAAKRDPALTISKKRVQELSGDYRSWEEEIDQMDKGPWESRMGSWTALSMSFYRDCAFKLGSYERLLLKFTKLTRQERVDLAALSWFAREMGESWTDLHDHAEETIGSDFNYEIGLGANWLKGLRRWENPPE